MAKKINAVKKETVKRNVYKAMVEGEEVEVLTTNKCVGKLIHASLKDAESDCAKCQASGSNVAKVCLALSGPDKNEAGKVQKKKGEVKAGTTKKETVKKAKKVVGPIGHVAKANGVNGKFQNRLVGKRDDKNGWGHFIGSIADLIDNKIVEGKWTKAEIADACDTKLSRVNSHINHLKKVKEIVVNAPRGGVVSTEATL